MITKNSLNLSNFEEAWKSIPHGLKPKVRDEIKAAGYIDTDWKFNDRRTGRVQPCEVEAIGIIKVFKNYGIDAITGKALKSAVA